MCDVSTQIITQLCIFLFLYIIFAALSLSYFGKNTRYNNISKREKSLSNTLFFLLLIMCIICNDNGDYYTYRNWFIHTYGETAETDEWIEPIYYWIRAVIPSSFLIFKAVIWGTGIFVFRKICEKVGINQLLSYILFGVFYISTYSYARASLGIMITSYAFVSFINKDPKTKIHYIKLILLCILAMYLHKSSISLMLILAVSLFLRFNKKTLIVLAILFIPLSEILNSSLGSLGGIVGLSEMQSERYFNTELDVIERGDEIRLYYPILILLLISLFKLYKHQSLLPPHIERIAAATILILYVATLLSTLTVTFAETIALRFYLMAFVPGLICCTYAIQEFRVNKKIIIFLIIYNVLFKLYAMALIIHYGAKSLLERYYN